MKLIRPYNHNMYLLHIENNCTPQTTKESLRAQFNLCNSPIVFPPPTNNKWIITWACLNIAVLIFFALTATISTTVSWGRVSAGSCSGRGAFSTIRRAFWPVSKGTPSTVNCKYSLDEEYSVFQAVKYYIRMIKLTPENLLKFYVY